MTAQIMQIGNRPCRIYGEAHAEYLLLQMTGEHELQSMDSEVAAIAQSAHHFLFAAIPVESWNDALSPWEAPAVWGTQGFGGNAMDTLRFLIEQVIPTLKRQFHLPENVKIILGGYSLAGLFALWASTQTDLFYRGNLPEGKRSVPQAELLEQLYQKFNFARPTDYHGHSLSVSDVIMLNQDGKISAHYVDSIGFKELPGFLDTKPDRPSVLMNLKEKCDAPECNPSGCKKERSGHEL